MIASLPLSRRFTAIPLPVLQIGIGAALAWPVNRGVHVDLDPEIFLLVFVPPLLFSDAWRAPKRELLQLRGAIAAMAFGLVFFTIAAFGYAMHWLVPAVPLVVAFAAAAALSPTDAVAVASIVDEERLPARLLNLLEGESLLNDAFGLVMFRFAVAAALTGAFSFAAVSFAFLTTVGVGVLVGFVCLWAARKALRRLATVQLGAAEAQVLVMLVLPFLAYLLAEHLHASGVLAAVVAGLFVSRMRVMASVAGVRGAVTLAGALSLPLVLPDGTPFPARELVIFLAAGVILCWLAIASVMLPRITRPFGRGDHHATLDKLRRARIATAEAALGRLAALRGTASATTA